MSSQAFALVTQDAALLRCELDRVRAAFTPALAAVSGLGVWHDHHVVHRSWAPGQAGAALWEPPDSEFLVLGARTLAVGEDVESAGQPFRFRQWMFVATGALDRAVDVRDRLWNELPEFLQGTVRGPTWEETAFVRFLAELRELGRMEDPHLDAATAAACLRAAARAVEQVSAAVGAARKPGLAFIASNGAVLAATRRGAQPLGSTLLEGRTECARHGLSSDAREGEAGVRDHRRRKSVVISSTPLEGWVALADGAAMGVDRRLAITLT